MRDDIAVKMRDAAAETCDDCPRDYDLLIGGADEIDALRSALRLMLDRYLALVNSGDAGNWDPEDEPQVKAARAILGD